MGSATLVKPKIRLNFKFLFYNLFCVVLLVTLGPVLWALRSIYVIAYDDHITGIKELIISLIFIAVSFISLRDFIKKRIYFPNFRLIVNNLTKLRFISYKK